MLHFWWLALLGIKFPLKLSLSLFSFFFLHFLMYHLRNM